MLILLVAHLMNPLFLFFAVASPSCLSMVGHFFPSPFCPLATRGQGLAQRVEIEPRSNHLRANHHFFFGMMHGFGRVRTRHAARFWLSGNKAPLPISPDLDSPRDIRSSCRSPSQPIVGSVNQPVAGIHLRCCTTLETSIEPSSDLATDCPRSSLRFFAPSKPPAHESGTVLVHLKPRHEPPRGPGPVALDCPASWTSTLAFGCDRSVGSGISPHGAGTRRTRSGQDP